MARPRKYESNAACLAAYRNKKNNVTNNVTQSVTKCVTKQDIVTPVRQSNADYLAEARLAWNTPRLVSKPPAPRTQTAEYDQDGYRISRSPA